MVPRTPSPEQLLRLPLLLSFISLCSIASGNVGVNYGTLGDNLPRPKKVAQLLQSTLFSTVKIYDTNPDILDAFSNTGIDLIVAVENQNVANLTASPSAADRWLSDRVLPFLPATSIVAIAVGNEYLTTDPYRAEPNDLAQALKNLHSALKQRGLDRKIKVTTPHSMAVLASSFPPSSSSFAITLVPTMTDIVGFLADTASPFMVNAYPYFAYRDSPDTVSLQYALLGNGTKPSAGGVKDPETGLAYTNMLDAQIDAVRSAIAALGLGSRGAAVNVTVSESGWPSKGEAGEGAATPENARTYNSRLIERGKTGKGTPMKPNDAVQVFVFALFNENRKEGGASERNFGVLKGDGSKAYDVDLSCQFCSGGGHGQSESGAGSGSGPSVWCVAKPHADEKLVEEVVAFCCGAGGVDCRDIEEKGSCHLPNRTHAHASYAMNAYYHMHGRNYWNCDFKGAGLVTFTDPSYGSCGYRRQ